jgi:hypothetical protein
MAKHSNASKARTANAKWNLLICGPIEHGGLVQSPHVAGGLLRKEHFDCSKTIIKNIHYWGHLFDKVRFVSWNNQADLITKEIKRLDIDIHLLDDPGRESSFCGDSRIRVMTAMAAGLREAIEEDTYTLRIRSDQFFNLETMIRSHEKSEVLIRKNQRDSGLKLPHISALCFWLDRPYSLCNYAHAARTRDLLEFAEAQIRYRHASALADNGWPEGDTIRKHLYSLRAELRKSDFTASQCFPTLPKSLTEVPEGKELHNIPKATLRLWEFALKNIYSVAPVTATASLCWKGEKYPHPRIFNNGMRFHRCWKRIAKRDIKPILDYCVNTFDPSSEISDPLCEDTWLLRGQADKLQNA